MSNKGVVWYAQPRWGDGILLALLALLLWSHLAGLQQSLWCDEVYTVVNYVKPGPRAIFRARDYQPNNHMLFSLLTWATVSLIGTSERTLRLWGVIPGCLAVIILTLWLRRRDGDAAAIAFALLAFTAPLMLDYSREARGYGLAFLANATLIIAAIGLTQTPRARWSALAFGGAGLVGITTLPVFVLPFVATATPLVASSNRALRRVAVRAVVVVGCLCLAFFAPVLRAIVAASEQHFGEQLAWHAAVTQAPYDLFRRELGFYGIATSEDPWLVGSIFYALTGLGALRLARRHGTTAMLAVALPLPLTYGALSVVQFYVEDRFVSYLTVNTLFLVSLGVAEAVAFVARWRVLAIATAIAVAVPIVHGLIAFVVISENAITIPREDWKAVASVVQQAGEMPVWTNSIRPWALKYYVPRVVIAGPQRLDQMVCHDDSPLIFVDQPIHPIPVDVGCLARSSAIRVPIVQREHYGDASKTTTVWIRR